MNPRDPAESALSQGLSGPATLLTLVLLVFNLATALVATASAAVAGRRARAAALACAAALLWAFVPSFAILWFRGNDAPPATLAAVVVTTAFVWLATYLRALTRLPPPANL